MDRFGRKSILALIFFSFSIYGFDISKTVVKFDAATNIPATIVSGESSDGVSGKLKEGAELEGEAFFKLDTLKTGIGLRDRHMLEDLFAAKNPQAKLLFRTQGKTFSGNLTLNGMTRLISGQYDSGKFSFEIQMKDFSVRPRQYLGVGITGLVKVQVQLK